MLDELKQYDQWIVWQLEEGRKIPKDPKSLRRASTTARSTWSSYSHAERVFKENRELCGLGFVFTSEDTFFGIDIDKCIDDEGVSSQMATDILQRMTRTYAERSPSGKGYHIIGRGDRPKWAHKRKDDLGLELYDRGRYFTITWDRVDGHEDDVNEAQESLDIVCSKHMMKEQSRERERRGQAEMAPVYQQGERDEKLFDLARSLFHRGMDKWQAYLVLERVGENCQPPFEQEEARRKVDSAWKTEDPHPMEIMRSMNSKYAMIKASAEILVEPEGDEMPNLLSMEALRKIHAAEPFVRYEDSRGRLREKNVADYWMTHAERRNHKKIVFKPSGKLDNEDYNLWNGFRVEPKKGDCSMFLQHVRENVASGDEELGEWVLDWLAGIVQDPGGGPRTALVLQGGQGVGKTVVGEYMRQIIGDKHFQRIAHHDHFVGRFNYDLVNNVFVHLDEATWGGDKRSEGMLKSLITDKKITVEMKGRDRFQIDNNVHLLITSNEEWPIPIGEDDRRFVVVNMGPRYTAAGQDFFDRLFDEMEERNGPEALLYYLKYERTLDKPDPDPPRRKRKSHRNIKEASLDDVGKVLMNWLEEGKVGARQGWVQVVPARELYESYRREAREMGFRTSRTIMSFRKRLNHYLMNEVGSKRSRSANSVRKEYGIEEDESDPLPRDIEQGRERELNRVIVFTILPSIRRCRELLEAGYGL